MADGASAINKPPFLCPMVIMKHIVKTNKTIRTGPEINFVTGRTFVRRKCRGSPPGAFLLSKLRKEVDAVGRNKEPPRVAVRLTESEKKKIDAAVKCGLTVSEYMRQRALGYESLDGHFIGTPKFAPSQQEEFCVIICRDRRCSSKRPYDDRQIRPAAFFQ